MIKKRTMEYYDYLEMRDILEEKEAGLGGAFQEYMRDYISGNDSLTNLWLESDDEFLVKIWQLLDLSPEEKSLTIYVSW